MPQTHKKERKRINNMNTPPRIDLIAHAFIEVLEALEDWEGTRAASL
jgi:hypothetical protein